MMQHIRDEECIKMTTLDKANFKKNTPWNTASHKNIYWEYLDDLTKNLKARDIATSGNEEFSVFVAQMWDSDYFTEESLIKWGKKAMGEKTWANVKI